MKRLFALLALSISLTAYGQYFNADTLLARYDVFSRSLSPEKCFLHIDRTAFCTGETVWFSGYVVNASSLSGRQTSNYIYVELITPYGEIETCKKIKRDGLSFPGYIDLREDLKPGTYTVRAYTLSQLDLSPEYLFNQAITIQKGRKHARSAKTKATPDIDVSFYPEGGRYFAGSVSRIAFKAMDSSGRSVSLSGEVVDGQGNVVSSASTAHDGMGFIQFVPCSDSKYSFRTSDGRSFDIPEVSDDGAALSCVESSGRHIVKVRGVSGGQYSLLLRDASVLRLLTTVALAENASSVIIPDGMLNPGINHLLLIDSAGRIVSERLFFKEFPDVVGSYNVKFGNTAEFVIDNVPDGSTCSISVLQPSLSDCFQDDCITSYLGLSSEIRGKINDPYYYFSGTDEKERKERAFHLDLLMMVQGWTYYDIDRITDTSGDFAMPAYQREYTQMVTGTVDRMLSHKVPDRFNMFFLIPSQDRSTVVSVEEGRDFVVDSLDFEEGTSIWLKVNRESRGFPYVPSWNKDEFATMFNYRPAPGYAWIQEAPVNVEFSVKSDTLKAAVITAEKPYIHTPGPYSRTVTKSKFEAYSHMSFVKYMKILVPFFQYDYTTSTMRSVRGGLRSAIVPMKNSGDPSESRVKLVVNGVVSNWFPFEDILVENIESISYSTEPDLILNAPDGVVYVNLHYGTQVKSLSDSDPSFLVFMPLGYQQPREFYSPKYTPQDYLDDSLHQNTLYWNPSLTAVDGKVKCDFPVLRENISSYPFRLEGITADGTPFSLSGRF